MTKIFTSTDDLEAGEIRELYDGFDAPVTALDCGTKCALYNPNGKPFCCDICHAVPAAYRSEWAYLKDSTDLWHVWRADECAQDQNAGEQRKIMEADTPRSMMLLACLGPDLCQRAFRALSCRQFPFFPYVTSDYRFLGLAYEWEFERVCWVISNLEQVSARFRAEFIRTYDHLFVLFQDEFDAYAVHSERTRVHYEGQGHRFPLLHRNGRNYLVSPRSERIAPVDPHRLPRFRPYR